MCLLRFARGTPATRRHFLSALPIVGVGLAGLGAATGFDGLVVEPFLRLGVTKYHLRPHSWPVQFGLSIAVIADLHACNPWMTVSHVEEIVDITNNLRADVILLLGDYVAGHDKVTSFVADRDWARALGALRARYGVFAILGNHDWWADERAQLLGRGPPAARLALEHMNIRVLENEAVKVNKSGNEVWIAGLGDQEAFYGRRNGLGGRQGADDLDAVMQQITGEAPAILMVHEPDIFPKVPERIGVTLAGHTHGGQIRPFGEVIFAPSLLSRRYIYGHFEENTRHLIVSGGLGCSTWPVRFNAPPEVVYVTLGG